MKLSAVVITKNEERNLARCLSSLSFCDEIVVVDAESTDNTRGIAASHSAKVITQAWLGYTAQKNFAVKQCTHDWVLSLDADEEVTEELRSEIQSIMLGGTPFSAFSVPRKTLHFGRWIKHGGWYPNRLVRLFSKSQGEWVGTELHEKWESRGKVGELTNDLVHYSFQNLADQVSRNNRYSSLGAQRLFKEGKRFSVLKITLKSYVKFFETYILKLGFLDGYPGFIISVSAAYSVFLKWAKLWELEQGGEKV